MSCGFEPFPSEPGTNYFVPIVGFDKTRIVEQRGNQEVFQLFVADLLSMSEFSCPSKNIQRMTNIVIRVMFYRLKNS